MRSRSLKPGFFKNEELADLGPYAMLLFAGLWTLADREGRLDDRPPRIRVEIFPYAPRTNVVDLLGRLERAGFIIRYDVNGSKYIQILNFSKHQNPHVKEAPSTIPAPDLHQMEPARATLTPSSPIPSSPIPSSPIPDSRPRTQANVSKLEAQPELEARANRIYGLHPKKTGKPLFESALIDLAKRGVDLNNIEACHAAWCKTSNWLKENGRYAPQLAQWLLDDGWTKWPDKPKQTNGYSPPDPAYVAGTPEWKAREQQEIATMQERLRAHRSKSPN